MPLTKRPLFDAIQRGMRPGKGFRAALSQWLGMPIALTDHEFWADLKKILGSWTGQPVTVDTALQLATVWACVRIIAETLSTLPLGFYMRLPDGSRQAAPRHPLYNILHNQPNTDQSAVVFWEIVVASMLLWGNGYCEIIRTSGTVSALNFLIPQRIRVRRVYNGAIEYRYHDIGSNKERLIPESSIMHIPAFTTDGWFGLSPVVYGAQVFGSALEAERISAETFHNSMRSPGLVTMDTVLKKEQREEIRAHVDKVSKDGGVMVLEKGAGFEKLGFDPVSAELLATRSFNVEEICRWFRIDPAMVGHGAKDSNWGTGLEQKMLWFITFTLRPWCVRIEQAIRKDLLTTVEKQTYFAEFAMEGLLRGDSTSRSAYYATMTQNGIYTRDDCRMFENKPPMGGNAAVLTVQSNLVPLNKLGETPPPPQRRSTDAVPPPVPTNGNALAGLALTP